MKYSRQRELIYKTVMENPIHPSADTVYALVRKEHPTISLGTVYRNLNLLVREGLLQKISFPNVSDHFDGKLEKHCHILCEQCGQVYDIDSPCLDIAALQKAPCHFQLTGCHIYFTGICETCLSQQKIMLSLESEEKIQ